MSAPVAGEQYATVGEVAQRYRKSVHTVRYWRRIGYGPRSVRVGRSVLFPLSELEAFDRKVLSDAAAQAA